MPDPLEEILGIITRRHDRDQEQDIVLGNPRQGYRVTPKAWEALTKHHGANDISDRVLAALAPLAPIAHTAHRYHCVLCTNYDFDAKTDAHTLWYVPNQHGGITIALPHEEVR